MHPKAAGGHHLLVVPDMHAWHEDPFQEGPSDAAQQLHQWTQCQGGVRQAFPVLAVY